MPVHGFTKDKLFRPIHRTEDRAHLRLDDDDESLRMFPFPFQLDIHIALFASGLSFAYEASNSGETALPYAIGFHPGFNWTSKGNVVFEREENPEMPCIAAGGLLARRTRHLPLEGRILHLHGGLFDKGALVFRNARSKEAAFHHDKGAVIRVRCEGFPHLAIWNRPGAPFLSLEAWSGHADWVDFDGELTQRDGMTTLLPGEKKKHEIVIDYHGVM